jgi:folate-dependent phosphoribosylglycinamide formyltransferase PurN
MLPKYPGANPWKGIYENKEKESGVTIHVIDEGIDTGTIIAQRKMDIDIGKDIKWHQNIVEKKAIEMLYDILFALNDSEMSSS